MNKFNYILLDPMLIAWFYIVQYKEIRLKDKGCALRDKLYAIGEIPIFLKIK